MTYIELLNRFWDSTRFNPCTSNEAAMYLYLYLLHQCNIRRWINPFEFRTRDLELLLGLSRTTITALRNKLKQRGLIDFSKGVGSGKSLYLIIGAKVTDEITYKKICVQSEDTKLDTMVDTKVYTKLDTKVYTNGNPTLYKEEKRKKTKDISPCGDSASPLSPEPSLFAEEDRRNARKKSKTPKSPPESPPTLEEVLRYFLSQDADKRLENWEESARRFFDNFTAVDWRDKFNRRITRWDSRANSWILDDEQRQKERKQNERSKTDRQDNPSGGIPIRGKVTPNCGLKRRNPE